MLHQDTHGVGTHTDKRGMAEADHAAKAQDEIQAGGRQSQYQDAAGKAYVEAGSPVLRRPGQGNQQHECR